MKQHHAGKRLIWIAAAFVILAFMVTLSLTQTGRVVAQGPTTQPTAAPDAQSVLDRANQAVAGADRAMSFVNLMLAFISVAGAIIGIGAAVGGIAGVRTIQEYRAELDRARGELTTMQNELKSQSSTIRDQSLKAIKALSLLTLGEQQLEAKNLKSAQTTYTEAYALDPQNPATNYFLGNIYIEQNELEKGIDHLKKAIANSGHYPPAEAALAYAYRKMGDKTQDTDERRLHYADAEQMFLRALSEDPAVRDINGESVWGVLGGLYKKQGRIDDAVDAYRNAERITPNNSYPVINLALLYFMRGDTAAAEPLFMRSAAISARTLDGNPTDYWTRFDLATALLILGVLEEAQQHLTNAISQMKTAGPLEIFLNDLKRLKHAPTPPDHVDEMIEHVTKAISQLRNETRVGVPTA